MNPRAKAKLKAGCGLIAVFSVGFLAGALVLVLFLARVIPLAEGWKDEDSKEFIVNRLAKRLELREEQLPAVREIVETALEERHARRADYTRSDIEITRRALERIREQLDPEQEAAAERMFENWLKGRKRYLGPAPPVAPGGKPDGSPAAEEESTGTGKPADEP